MFDMDIMRFCQITVAGKWLIWSFMYIVLLLDCRRWNQLDIKTVKFLWGPLRNKSRITSIGDKRLAKIISP